MEENSIEMVPSFSGWLIKLGRFRKTWKRRWFILGEGTISYYLTQVGSFSFQNFKKKLKGKKISNLNLLI